MNTYYGMFFMGCFLCSHLFVSLGECCSDTCYWLSCVTIRTRLTPEPWSGVHTAYTRKTGLKLALTHTHTRVTHRVISIQDYFQKRLIIHFGVCYLVHIITTVSVSGESIRTGTTFHPILRLSAHVILETHTRGALLFHWSSTQS